MPSFSVLDAATLSPHTPDLLSCCKKLSPIDRLTSSFSFSKAAKACGVPKSTFQKCSAHIIVQALGYLKASNVRASQYL